MASKKNPLLRQALNGVMIATSLAAMLLSGCATRGNQPLYYWGDFSAQQYDYFTGDKGPEAAILALEKIQEQAKAKGKPLPPGFQAHMGMLYGLTGRTDLFEQSLLAEQKQFPESSGYIEFLLKNKQKVAK